MRRAESIIDNALDNLFSDLYDYASKNPGNALEVAQAVVVYELDDAYSEWLDA